MRVKSSVFIATSLDGYIAREDGSLDWLDQVNEAATPGEDFGYDSFIASVDALVMGRNTFEKVLSFGSNWPYGSKPTVVLSRGQVAIPPSLAATVSTSSEPPRTLVERLAASGAKHLYIDGGLTIQSFLREGLIDEITLTLIPVLLGSGKPLFGPLDQDLKLTHLATQTYRSGFVQHQYRVMKQA
jgi:dihydrofolate reductase